VVSDGSTTPPDVLRLRDLIPGLISVSRRLPSIYRTLKILLGLRGDTRESMGTVLEQNADRYPNHTAILYEDVRLTHDEFNRAVNRYAHFFLSRGLATGDVATVLVDNRPELLMIIGALSKIGAVSSLINPNQRGEVLLHSVNLTRHRTFIVGEELIDAFEAIVADLGLTADDLLLFLPERSATSAPAGYLDLRAQIESSRSTNPATVSEVRLQDPFAHVFTSGTTGLPKASVQTHRRWFAGRYWFGKIVMNLKPTDVLYCPLPFCHTNALNVAWGACAGHGAAIAIRRRFSASSFLDDVRKYDANSFIYVGELCRYLMNQPPKADDSDNPLVSCVGNGLRPDIWKAFKKRYGIEKVYELYGAAEGTLIFTNLLNVDRTVGMCLSPFAVVKCDVESGEPIRGENGFALRSPPGENGLILGQISESLPFSGYTDEGETQKKIVRDVFEQGDAWFNFGDLVMNQGFRHIQFVDRLGDTFRWKGENVSTGEVEKVVNSMAHVSESTAYGVEIPGTEGRAGMLAVIPSTDVRDFDLAALAELTQRALPSYAVPRFVRFKTEFETTGTHKIKKTLLRDEAFDPDRVDGPVFALLPGETEYVPLTRDLYREIAEGRYGF
jgi:citronellyl-CoA synthetase